MAFNGTPFRSRVERRHFPAYTKQKHLPVGQDLETFTNMFSFKVLTEGASPRDAVVRSAAIPEQRRASNLLVQYALVKPGCQA